MSLGSTGSRSTRQPDAAAAGKGNVKARIQEVCERAARASHGRAIDAARERITAKQPSSGRWAKVAQISARRRTGIAKWPHRLVPPSQRACPSEWTVSPGSVGSVQPSPARVARARSPRPTCSHDYPSGNVLARTFPDWNRLGVVLDFRGDERPSPILGQHVGAHLMDCRRHNFSVCRPARLVHLGTQSSP
jgi:hypothetical protein